MVFAIPGSDRDKRVYRSASLYREETDATADEDYSRYRREFTDASMDWNWKLYREEGQGSERSFVSYQGVRIDTVHGVPIWLITDPHVLIGVLKGNIFVVIDYSSYRRAPDYIETINGDVRYIAALLAKAAS